MASAHPTNGVAEDEGKSGGLWPAVEALLLAASLFHGDDKSCDKKSNISRAEVPE